MEHRALAAGDALTRALHLAAITILLVCVTITNMLPIAMVLIIVVESHHLLHVVHLMPEAMVLMIMATGLTKARAVTTCLADTMKD
jgi:hypothetical protein